MLSPQVRSSKQDQIHNSIVSTLLALMDGLDSRGSVVVIGGHCCQTRAMLPLLIPCISSPPVWHRQPPSYHLDSLILSSTAGVL